jgi:ABC-2 type transport system permease protein
MINSRLSSLVRKEFIQIVRDPRTLMLMFGMPIIMLFLLGYAATNDVRNVPTAILDQDRSAAARDLISAFRAADYFQFAFDVDSVEEMKLLIDNGQARAGLIIPPDYSAAAGGEQAQVACDRRIRSDHCRHRFVGGNADWPDEGDDRHARHADSAL